MSRSISVVIHPKKGRDVNEVCGDVKELSEFMGVELAFEMNGVTIDTNNKSIDEMVASYVKVR